LLYSRVPVIQTDLVQPMQSMDSGTNDLHEVELENEAFEKSRWA
jgi:hypothetical protein